MIRLRFVCVFLDLFEFDFRVVSDLFSFQSAPVDVKWKVSENVSHFQHTLPSHPSYDTPDRCPHKIIFIGPRYTWGPIYGSPSVSNALMFLKLYKLYKL